MTSSSPRSSARFGLVILLGLSLCTLLGPAPAFAQHRARMPQSLTAKLQAGGTAPVSVMVEDPQSEVDRLAQTYGVHVVKRLGMGAVLTGSAAQIDSVAGDSNVRALSEDDVVVSTMAITTQSTGASLLWGSNEPGRYFSGLTGRGVGVAILDSGVAPHPDVANRVRLSLDFTGAEDTGDGYGHGTHLAGIIAGSGAGSRSADGTAYVGMAPGAELLSLRVLASDGTGYVSNVIAGLEWAIANQARYRIRVINLSLGHAAGSDYRDDPLAQAVERAVASGLVVVASAGNLGKTEDGTPVIGAIVSPGYTPGALTVGALNTHGTVARSDDGVTTYSSRGPVGDPNDPSTWEIKPDLVAPGNAIISAGAEGSYLWNNYPERHVIGASGGTYLVLSGSSMATAVVSGAVAQLLQAQPRLTPSEVKFALQFTAEHLPGFGIIEQGAGSLNVPLAAALVESRGMQSAPASVEIAGEMISAGMLSFRAPRSGERQTPRATVSLGQHDHLGQQDRWGNTTVWVRRSSGAIVVAVALAPTRSSGAIAAVHPVGSLVWGSTIIWGNRGPGRIRSSGQPR